MDFEKLDEDQVNVVRWAPGKQNLRVVASAGSGKTTSVVALVTKLILVDEIEPQDICVLTYANKAGSELKTRLAESLGPAIVGHMQVGTYHAVGLNVLRRDSPEKWDMGRCCDLGQGQRAPEIPSTNYMWRCAVVFGTMPGTGEACLKVTETPDFHIQQACLQRADGRTFKDAKNSAMAKKFKEAWALVERCKTYYSAWDFDDVLFAWRDRLKVQGGSFRVVIVDEAQDNSRIQLDIAQLLTREDGNLVLVGDLRQTVHEWRGAYPKLFSEADKELTAETKQLRFNYRSRPDVVELCNKYATGKKWCLGDPSKVTREADGKCIFYNDFATHFEQGDHIAQQVKEELEAGFERSRVVLCRTRGLQAIMEGCFLALDVPVVIAGGGSCFRSPAAICVINYLTALHENNATALVTVLNTPKRYIPKNFGMRLQSEQRRHGEKIEAQLRRLIHTDSMSQSSKVNALELADFLENLRAATWKHRPQLLVELLKTQWEEGADAHESDGPGTVYAVAMLAARYDSYEGFRDFLNRQASAKANDESSVVLSTIHKAKGLEWDDVYVDVTHGNIPHAKAKGNAIQEEERLLYVALSRAKERLFLSAASAGDNDESGGRSRLLPSLKPWLPKSEDVEAPIMSPF
jgi:DNA helicase-2/ATP-dependent DNA helicase PcrA